MKKVLWVVAGALARVSLLGYSSSFASRKEEYLWRKAKFYLLLYFLLHRRENADRKEYE